MLGRRSTVGPWGDDAEKAVGVGRCTLDRRITAVCPRVAGFGENSARSGAGADGVRSAGVVEPPGVVS
jgi:hypothetical protein